MGGWTERNSHRKGKWLVVDDESGFVLYSDQVTRRWDGMIVDKSTDEPPQPQWFIRPRNEKRTVPNPRPEEPPAPACDTISPYVGTTIRKVGAASHLFVAGSIGTMEIGCSFTVFPDTGPYPPR